MSDSRSVSVTFDFVSFREFQTPDVILNSLVTDIIGSNNNNNRMVAVWLWKLNNKSKLLALMDQHLPPADASQIRTDLGTTEQSRLTQSHSVRYCLN